MNSAELRKKYDKMSPLYEKLKVRVTSDLLELIKESAIPILNVQSRVKDFNSFSAKCERKLYKSPFEENEDFLGLRIIVYFPDDLKKIVGLIDEEFDVKQSEDKIDGLNADQFGYRSVHKIVSIKEEWARSPGYRQLANLKCEIQIRTVLMHTWAEIEHKLQYKSAAAAPKMMRRKLSLLSAQLETADNQFQELQKEILDYREALPDNIASDVGDEVELNIETLQRYLSTKYPNREQCEIDDYQLLIDELVENGISSISVLENILSQTVDVFGMYESIYPPWDGRIEGLYSDVGVARVSLHLFNKDENMIEKEFFEKL